MKDLWILTEERPKLSVVKDILRLEQPELQLNEMKLIPRIENNRFKFIYDIEGVNYPNTKNLYLKIVSGKSSFFDYMIVKNNGEPNPSDKNLEVLYVVEETKTDDSESRNTGVYQRCSKFVYIDLYFKNIKKYMLYNNPECMNSSKKPSDTNIFGTNMLLTIGAEFHGKNLTYSDSFKNLDELIDFKNSMRRPPESNVPMLIKKYDDRIEVSGRLSKPAEAGNIGHDPNIGALSMIAKTLRYLGWKKDIVITRHGVSQSYIDKTKGKNKFLYICKLLNIKLKDIELPQSVENHELYWDYEKKSEKVASILTHIVSENNGFRGIYENHAGCERGYFWTKSNKPIVIAKKDKNNKNLFIPDLILHYPREGKDLILLIEGKQYSTLSKGLEEIENYDSIEDEYIYKYYPNSDIQRWITLFGGSNKSVPHEKVLLQVTKDGDILVNNNAPVEFRNMFK